VLVAVALPVTAVVLLAVFEMLPETEELLPEPVGPTVVEFPYGSFEPVPVGPTERLVELPLYGGRPDAEVVTPVPVGPTVTLVELPLYDGRPEAVVVAPVPVGPTTTDDVLEYGVLVIGAEWVWVTAVPFSVHKVVNVV
jgi:hypothetical protein